MTDISHGSTPLPNYYPLFDSSASPAEHPPIASIWGALTGTLTDQTDLVNYIANALAGIVATAPGALDTLKELADAIGDDANYAGTVTAALAARLLKTNNLSDLTSAVAARTNLGLGSAALLGAAAVVQVANNLSDLASVGTARSNLSVYSKAEVDAAITAATSSAGASIYPTPTFPNDASFSWLNQGTSTKQVNANGSVSVIFPQTGSIILRGRTVPLSSTTFTLKTGLMHNLGMWNYTGTHVGVILYDSVSGKAVVFGQYNDSGASYLIGANYTNLTTVQANFSVSHVFYGSVSPMYIKATGDGTSLTFYISRDGYNWTLWCTESFSGFLASPNQIGFFAYESGNALSPIVTCFHWSLT